MLNEVPGPAAADVCPFFHMGPPQHPSTQHQKGADGVIKFLPEVTRLDLAAHRPFADQGIHVCIPGPHLDCCITSPMTDNEIIVAPQCRRAWPSSIACGYSLRPWLHHRSWVQNPKLLDRFCLQVDRRRIRALTASVGLYIGIHHRLNVILDVRA